MLLDLLSLSLPQLDQFVINRLVAQGELSREYRTRYLGNNSKSAFRSKPQASCCCLSGCETTNLPLGLSEKQQSCRFDFTGNFCLFLMRNRDEWSVF